MNSIKLADNNPRLKQVSEVLRAIQTVITTIEGEEVISCERETLTVLLMALEPIISDFEKIIMTLTELCNDNNHSRPAKHLRTIRTRALFFSHVFSAPQHHKAASGALYLQ